MEVVKKSSLPTVRIGGEVAAYILEGAPHGNVDSSAFIVDVAPGAGPGRHRHPYDEIFIVVEGKVRLEAGGEVIEATPEEICVVPTDVPHSFTNVGPGRAQMVNIHVHPTAITEFDDDGAPDPTYEYNNAT